MPHDSGIFFAIDTNRKWTYNSGMEIEKIIDAIKNNKIVFDDSSDVKLENIRLSKNQNEYFLFSNNHINNSIINGEEISFYSLTNEKNEIHANKVGFIIHFFDDLDYCYNLYKLEMTNKNFLGKKIAAYGINFFFEIAKQKGYHSVFLNYRPTDKDDKNMFVLNENGELEHRANYLYRKNGFTMSYDDRGGAQQFKCITNDEIKNIRQNTININEIKVYKDIKTWSKENKEKVNEL